MIDKVKIETVRGNVMKKYRNTFIGSSAFILIKFNFGCKKQNDWLNKDYYVGSVTKYTPNNPLITLT